MGEKAIVYTMYIVGLKALNIWGAGKRRGLNALVVDPSFETFNTPMAINQPFTWNDRMYLAPLGFEESSKNLNLVQAPGY